MEQYEIAILYHPSLEVDLSKAEEQIFKIFTKAKGEVTNTDNWGKRKLLYPIKKQDYAIYVFYTVDLEPVNVKVIETDLNITDEIIRYLIVKPDLKKIAKAEAEKVRKAKNRSDDDDGESSDDSEEA